MADEKPPVEDKKEEKPTEYARIHNKSLRQLASESEKKIHDEVTKVETPKEEDKPEVPEEKPEKSERKRAPKVDVDEVARKVAEETASRVTAETKEAFKSEIDKILNKDKDIQDKQKEADELIASWDKEQRLPKDYKELIDETMRIADAKMAQKQRAEQTQREQERVERETKDRENKAELDKKQGEEKLQEFNKQIAQDLNELYDAKLLPRPTKFEEVNNEQTADEAAKETQKVLKFGVELNTRLVQEGKPPVTSLSKIYFLHYKPYTDANPQTKSTQPAGADAPIAGGRNTPTGGESKTVDYKQLHNETWSQTAARIARQARQAIANR